MKNLFAIVLFITVAFSMSAANVTITPLGSHAGEFCRNDRTVVPGTRLERFIQQVVGGKGTGSRVDVVVPLSDVKIECDSVGRCQ